MIFVLLELKFFESPFLVQFWCRWIGIIGYIGLDGLKPLDSSSRRTYWTRKYTMNINDYIARF